MDQSQNLIGTSLTEIYTAPCLKAITYTVQKLFARSGKNVDLSLEYGLTLKIPHTGTFT